MKHFEQSKMDKELVTVREFNRKVRMISTHLLTSLMIDPLGRQLLQVAQDQACSDNAEMVYRWVKQKACCASCIKVMSFQKLQKDFVRELLVRSIDPVSDFSTRKGKFRGHVNIDSAGNTTSSAAKLSGAAK